MFDGTATVGQVISSLALQGRGRMLFPLGDYAPPTDARLSQLERYLPWYSEVRLETTLDVLRDVERRAEAGERVFIDIYDEAERASDPTLEDTCLIAFPAAGATGPVPFAICCAGGGFVYVGAIHDSMPAALEISRAGCAAFALIYRPDRELARRDLARAIWYLRVHADELGIVPDGYSLWGGSAGARIVRWLGSDGPAAYGAPAQTPGPAALIMQYTSCSDFTPHDPPCYANMGEADTVSQIEGLASRMEGLAAAGIPAVFKRYPGLDHGYGIGRGTVAEGWVDEAIAFWREQL